MGTTNHCPRCEELARELDSAQARCFDFAAELCEWQHEATEEQRAIIKARCGGKDPLGELEMELAAWRAKAEARGKALENMRSMSGCRISDAERHIWYRNLSVHIGCDPALLTD